MKTELQIAADKLVNELFAVKPGETVMQDIAKQLQKAFQEATT